MQIKNINPDSTMVRALLDASDVFHHKLYPAISNHLEGVEQLLLPNVYFVGCFIGDELVGCGAVKVKDDDDRYGEIKRMFVPEKERGKGISKAIMAHLEAYLQSIGVELARLETGIRQPEALGLYASLGYTLRGPFGGYAIDPLSVFMEKKLRESIST